MKLKRFLLRYDPPGVGLELDDDGETTVRHKTLPGASQVTSFSTLQQLVDDMIACEPEILTRRRHRASLLQLFGRLYQIEVEGADEEEPDAAVQGSGISIMVENRLVVLVKLQGKNVQYNGEMGTIVKAQPEKGKCEVSMTTSGETIKIRKEEHLLPVAPEGTAIDVGIVVVIRGLRNHMELNGALARVVECHEKLRYEVRAFDSNQLFRVKQENLVPVDSELLGLMPPAAQEQGSPRQSPGAVPSGAPMAAAAPEPSNEEMFAPGTIVQLSGLKTAREYNGQSAEVLSGDTARSRYEIRLFDGSIKTIRCENVKFIGPAANKGSPRRRCKNTAAERPCS